MRAVYIIVEGQTEEEFVYTSLRPYLNNYGIYDVRAILVETSPGHKGGDLKFHRFKRNIENLLSRENDVLITSLIDFFRLQKDFPKFKEAQNIIDKMRRVAFLEKSIAENINNHRFIPYIQLHEFEAIVFSDKAGIEYIPDIPPKNKVELLSIIEQFPNPELLNDGPQTAPSKRLIRLIPGYQKTFHGPLMADEIGIHTILSKCPRFSNWVETIIKTYTLKR